MYTDSFFSEKSILNLDSPGIEYRFVLVVVVI